MRTNEMVILAAMLQSPGKHQARLSRLEAEWIRDKVLRILFKFLLRRPMSFDAACRHFEAKPKGHTRDAIIARIIALRSVLPPSSFDVDQAAGDVADAALRDHVLDRCRWIVESLEKGKATKAREVVRLLAGEIPNFDVSGSVAESIGPLALAVAKDCMAAKAQGGGYRATGFRHIDDVVGGARRGELWLWAGYAGDGKTFSSLNMAYSRWLAGDRVRWIPCEMENEDVSILFVARHSVTMFPEAPLETRAIRRGLLGTKGRKKLAAVLRDIRERDPQGSRWKLWQAPSHATIESIRLSLEAEWREEEPIDLLVIDYLEQLAPLNPRRSSREELNDTLAAAKAFARTYADNRGLCLLSPHQISRPGKLECEKRKPTPHYLLSDLAESSRAEREADVVAWTLRTRRMKVAGQVLVGIMKARGEETIELGKKCVEMYRHAYIGNLTEEAQNPSADEDFDPVA